MKAFKNTVVLTAVFILGFAACKNAELPVEAVMRETVLTGAVHAADGLPLGGVLVVSGDESMSTGADGAFVLNHAMTINGRTVVRFEKQGYFPLTRSGIFADEMHLDVLMQAKGNSGNSVATSFAADRTATLSAGGMKVDIPASSLTADDGKAYTGSVNADMFYLDPNSTGFASLMPGGDLAGISVGNGEAQLISYGMTAVLLTDNAGRALQLKKDAAAELTFPIPVGMDDNPPAEIPLWSFDEERGVWIEEGRATRQGNVYTGTAKHFSWINLDAPADRVTISGRLTDCNGDPVQRAKVTVGQVATSSDSRGDYSAFVPANTPVVVRVEGSGFSDGVEHAISAQRGGTTVTQDFSLPCRTASSVDKAVIFYSVDGGKNNAILTFDNNGRRMRWDTDYGTKNHLAIIVDELSRTYIMGVAGSWAEMSYENGLIESVFAMFLFNDEQYSKVPGYARLPGETIAEQLCTMISYPALNNCTQKYGGWHGMIMLNENCEKIIQRATEVRFDVPENTFTKTMDIFD